MQDDLISRSVLLNHIKEFTNINEGYFENPQLLVRVIENLPIAYDVEKVVKQLEENMDEYYKRMDEYDEDLGGYVATEQAIRIVNGGYVQKDKLQLNKGDIPHAKSE